MKSIKLTPYQKQALLARLDLWNEEGWVAYWSIDGNNLLLPIADATAQVSGELVNMIEIAEDHAYYSRNWAGVNTLRKLLDTVNAEHTEELPPPLPVRSVAERRFVDCVECGRGFDLWREDEADEWYSGHDCELWLDDATETLKALLSES